MIFFEKKQAAAYGVMEVGADAIKGMAFEMAPDRGSPEIASGLPRILEKFVWELPLPCSSLRLVKKIRESIFIMIEKMRRTPEKVVVALGPEVGEYALQSWTSSTGDAPLTRTTIREAHQRLFDERVDLRRAMIAAPVEVLVNGYPLIRQAHWQENRVLCASRAVEIKFRTLALFMTVENGALFAEIKNGLSGIPMDFIPLAVAEKEALVRDQHIRDAFLIDVGVEATALTSIREGRLIHTAFMALGIGRMAAIAAKKYRHSPDEARRMMRQYGRGESMGDEPSASASAAAADAAAEWKRGLLQILDAFYPTGPLSPAVFLSGEGARFPEIRASAMAHDWLGGFSYTLVPSARVLEGAAFFGGNTLGGNLQGPEDTGLAALMAYALRHEPIF